MDPVIEVSTALGTRIRTWRWVRWLVVYPVLALAGCHLVVTGSPIPLYHIESLRDPLMVREVRDDALVLADGRMVRVPLMRSLPRCHPLFRLALRHGVEVDHSGVVFGLIDPPRPCGNDAVVFYRCRTNLTDLAAWLHPEGIDDLVIPAEEIRDLREACPAPPPGRDWFAAHDRPWSMARYRLVIDHYVTRRDRP